MALGRAERRWFHTMSTIWRDYGERYAGVLGEADDLHFVRSGATSPAAVLVCWKPYLDFIMEGVGPSPRGWTALALEYHVEERWNDAEWELSDIPAAIEQFRGADRGVIERGPWGPTTLCVLNDLIVFLEAAVAAGQSIRISSH